MAATRIAARGDVFWADLVPRSGSEQQGRRPAIIVSHDVFNRAEGWQSLIVVPVTTSRSQSLRGPTAVGLRAGEGGLREDSIALCHQVTSLDRSKLAGWLGSLSGETLSAVEQGLVIALDLAVPGSGA